MADATFFRQALGNDGNRMQLPVPGLQEAAGSVGALLAGALDRGKFRLAGNQREEVKDNLSDMLWCLTTHRQETGVDLEKTVNHGLADLKERSKGFDPDPR